MFDNHFARDAAVGAPPAAIATLTYFGYPISDVVQFVMLLYGIALVSNQVWRLYKWVCRKGWNDTK